MPSQKKHRKNKQTSVPTKMLQQQNNNLAFSYARPYQGAGQLALLNMGDQPAHLDSLQFITNAAIDGTPWGSLFPWGSKLESKLNPNNQTMTHNVTFPQPGFTLPAHGNATMTYQAPKALGPLNIVMNPLSVAAVSKGIPANLPIDGKCQRDECNDPTPGRTITAYYTDWDMYARKYNAEQIPIDKVNHVVYAFIGYDADGNISLLDENADTKQIPTLAVMRQRYPYLKFSLSFGGWTLSKDFPQLAANPVALQNFVNNAISAVAQTQATGIDIDWEYPTAEQADSYAALLEALRKGLDELERKTGQTYELSIAAPAGIDKIQAIATAWKRIAAAVDQVNIMAYDYHGAWDKISNYQAAFKADPSDPTTKDPILSKYNVVSTVQIYQSLGFENKQLVLGIPAYGRAMYVDNVTSENLGLWQNVTGVPSGQYGDGSGVYDYACIIDPNDCNGLTGLPGDVKLVPAPQNPFGNYTKQPIGYGPQSRIFLTYDDRNSTWVKTHYAAQQGLGGVMYWTASGDAKTNKTNSLINTSYQVLKSTAAMMSKPLTQPIHIVDSSSELGNFHSTVKPMQLLSQQLPIEVKTAHNSQALVNTQLQHVPQTSKASRIASPNIILTQTALLFGLGLVLWELCKGIKGFFTDPANGENPNRVQCKTIELQQYGSNPYAKAYTNATQHFDILDDLRDYIRKLSKQDFDHLVELGAADEETAFAYLTDLPPDLQSAIIYVADEAYKMAQEKTPTKEGTSSYEHNDETTDSFKGLLRFGLHRQTLTIKPKEEEPNHTFDTSPRLT